MTSRVVTATVGGDMAAAPDAACALATGQKPGAGGMSRPPAVTGPRSPSKSTPTGVCARRPAMAPAESATPMLASSQACRSSR